MLKDIKRVWSGKYGYLIFVGACLLFLVGLSLYQKNKHGTFGLYYKTKKTRAPPKDSKGEIECKRVMEKLFRAPFVRDRPDFLRNDVNNGSNLELDIVNYDLGLAVEYSGKQHYEYNKFFHRNKEHFLNQKYRDEIKRMKCKENNITLIEVPYSIKIEDIESFLKKTLDRYGFKYYS